MIELIVDSVAVPVLVAIALLLIPRMPWCAESGQRTAAWTAPLAIAIVTAMSLYSVEGAAILKFEQRWNTLLLVGAVVGVGAAIARGSAAMGAGAAFLALFLLRLPGFDGIADRVLIGLAGAVMSFVMRKPMHSAPILATLATAVPLLSLAALLASVGSMKIALLAGALGGTATACGALTWWGPRFWGGHAFATAATTMAVAITAYGAAYHADADVFRGAWWLVAASPALMAIATISGVRSSRVRTCCAIGFCLVIALCVVIVAVVIARQG